ncbi:unnamed protein product [Rotaria magnacalcarata]|uniref:Uncharacterized protein n=1 Tax=Rotaria magnacalcarata TaxID=392030 RepID=A0A816X8A4_9BILA|nr:unnamed protein product [Rotaria magnacalcarata]
MNLNASISRNSDLDSTLINTSIGAPTPKNVPLETTTTTKTPVSGTHLIMPEWVHCELCKRRENNGSHNTRLLLGYCHPCGHIICRDCAMHNTNGQTLHVTEAQVREQIYKLYSNMYKQLFDVFDYQDAKWNQLMMHRSEYLRQMNKMKKGMIELDETRRVSKELLKICQGQEQDHARHQQAIRQDPSTIRPSSVASSTSLNFGPQQRQQINQNSSSVTKPMVIVRSPSAQHQHVSAPEPDKLMTYEQAMVYAHPALKDALRLAHRRKMSSKNSETITSK